MTTMHRIKSDRDSLAAQIAEYEKTHTVETTPILIREHTKAVFMETGIKDKKKSNRTSLINWNGKSYVLNDLIAEHGIRRDTFRERIKRGLSIDQALGLK
jgi:hypothetical protein